MRQLMERQAYCVFVYPERIFFVDGPLEGLAWTYTMPPSLAVFHSVGRGPILVDMDRLMADLQKAVENCAAKMAPTACAQTLTGP